MSICNCIGCPHRTNCRCRCSECNPPQWMPPVAFARPWYWQEIDSDFERRIKELEEEVKRLSGRETPA